MTADLQDYRLDRTGHPPVEFRGELLAGAYDEDLGGDRRRNPRWHDLELYRTASGRYVLHVRYTSAWKDEVGRDDVLVLESPRDVVAALGGWDPTGHVEGFPDHEQFRKKQERLLAEVRARFGRCVSDLYGQLGSEFSERVG